MTLLDESPQPRGPGVDSEPVRLAIVGTGGIGRLHAELAATHSAVELVAVSSIDDDAEGVARRLSVPLVRDYRDLLDHAPEAVLVATPNKTHLDIGGFFVAAGVPTLVEKPIADSTAAGRELCEIADQASVPLLVGHHRRHHSLVQAARRFVESDIGTLVATTSLATMRKPDSYYEVEWRRSEGAGPLLVNLIHEIDVLRAVCGEIESVQAASARLARDFAFDDTATIIVRFAGGALGTLVISESTPSPWSWEASVSDGMGFHNAGQDHAWFIGTEAALSFPSLTMWRYDSADPDPGWHSPLLASRLPADDAQPVGRSAYARSPTDAWHRTVERRNPYADQMTNLANVARGVEEPVVSGREGLRNLVVVDAVVLAARTGEVVEIEGLLDEM